MGNAHGGIRDVEGLVVVVEGLDGRGKSWVFGCAVRG